MDESFFDENTHLFDYIYKSYRIKLFEFNDFFIVYS
ncbi:Uncharacterised protein [Staphylococcus caeli]|uniref:Uncharacterized protein n=1 Tax=Staphylococcus caeli TaxID=2201815 RepID=A0A1D4K9E8_9STAP|nr:Uncharacterised protein [Staphylococcus caeli]SCS78208.1 Uncharacterised protein [Staphylococcus caeli]